MKIKWISNGMIIIGILALILMVNAQLLITLISPEPFYYTNIPFPLSKREYTAEDKIVMTVARCSHESKSVSVVSVKEIYNTITGDITPLPPGSGIVPPGCSTTETAFASIFPTTLDEGTYVIRGSTTFRGKFGTVDAAWQTQSFVYRR